MKKHSCFACGHPGTGHDPQCPVRIFELVVDHDILHGKKPFIVTSGQRAGRQTMADLFIGFDRTAPGERDSTVETRVVKGRGFIPGGLDNLPKCPDYRLDPESLPRGVLSAGLTCGTRYFQQAMYAHKLHESHMRIAEALRAQGCVVEVVGDSMLVDIESGHGRLLASDFADLERRISYATSAITPWSKMHPAAPVEEDKPKAPRSMLSLLARAQGSKVKVE